MNGILFVSSFCVVCGAVSRSIEFLGEMFFCGYSARSQGSSVFSENLAPFLAFVVKVGIVTTEAPQSKKLRAWNGIFYEL